MVLEGGCYAIPIVLLVEVPNTIPGSGKEGAVPHDWRFFSYLLEIFLDPPLCDCIQAVLLDLLLSKVYIFFVAILTLK
jgi:hypothetical protein